MNDEATRKALIKDLKIKSVIFIVFICVLVLLYFTFISKYINKDVAGGVIAGNIAGDIGIRVGNFFNDFGMFISNMGVINWILLLVIVGGGFLVLYLKNKYGLKFGWSPKGPKKTLN